jgi:predicted CXXCH cytochrome family protein
VTGVVNPAHLNADQRDSICISCHLEGDVTVARAGRSALKFVPGESISNYLSYYVYRGESLTQRGVSEVEQLTQSTCKKASGDKMSCTSCHDPHFTPNAAQRTAFYRSKCLSCHSEPQFAAAHHTENQDCTSCHMRRTGSENIPHVAWTDHRILRLPEIEKPAQSEVQKQTLVPIFSPGATSRDLAMAYYKAMLAGNPALEPEAWRQLSAQRDTLTTDTKALDALGNMSAERRQSTEAEALFRQVLAIDPDNLTSLSNLSTLLARQGKLKDAIALLSKAFDRNQNISGLAMNLARVECAAGDAGAVRRALEKTLVYNPHLQSVDRLMTQLSDCAVSSGKQ